MMKTSRNIRKKLCSMSISAAFSAVILTFCILPASALTCDCGDICVNTSGWWRDDGLLNNNDMPIQAAVDNATAGETIYVWNGSYSENVDVTKQLTLAGEGMVNVSAASADDHVFEVTANYVNISGFSVSGATGSSKSGFYLSNRQHCNILDNNASGNYYGIYLSSSSSNNTIYNNYFNNTNNAWDDGYNIWNTTPTSGTNIIGGSWLGGNYWSDYAGSDTIGDDGLGDTLCPYNSSDNIQYSGDYHPLVTPGIAAPNITSSAPPTSVSTTTGATQTFNITIDQTVNVTWHINGTSVQETNTSITVAHYINSSAKIGVWNISAMAENTNGTDMQTWVWNVMAASQTYNCTCVDICVNTSGWWRDGSAFNASSTPIQAAVDAAAAGKTIYVYSGSYSENVNVNKRVTLQGEGADVVNVTAASALYHVFDVTGDYVNISGFNVSGTAYPNAGIYLSGRQHCNISNNTASGNYYGIYMRTSSNNTLTNNTANSNNNRSIYLYSSSNNTLTSNIASNNSNYGIRLVSSSNNTLMNNIVSNNSNYGILLSSSSNNTLKNNTVSNNSQRGIKLSSSSNNTLTNNTASNNRYGILLFSSNNNTLTNNTASNNSNYGIYLLSSSNNNTLTNNTASNNSQRGIKLTSSSNNTLTNNNASNNKYGILLSSSSNNTLTNNTVSNNNQRGIWLSSSSNNTLMNNTADSNSNYGIYLYSSSNNMLTNNNADSNSNYGIRLVYSSNNTLMKNTVSNNSQRGIWLSFSSDNTLRNNTANSNSNYGIYLYSSCNNTLTNNTASNNSQHGIYLLSSSNNNTLTNNNASDNTQYGIYLTSSNSNTIYNNYFNNTYNSYDNGNNIWNTTPISSTNIIGGSWLGGNYWSDYAGSDTIGDDGLGDTLIPYKSNITNGGDYHPLVTSGFTAPSITSLAPPTSVSDTAGATRTFNITIDQIVNVTWYINGTSVQETNTSVTAADYMNTSAELGVWNVSAVVENANGTDMQTWVWNVTGESLDLQRINVTLSACTLNVSESVNFNATGFDHDNDQINQSNLTFNWYTTPAGIGTLNITNNSVVSFTALHTGRTEMYAINGSVSSNETYKVWVTVNVPPEPGDVINGTGNTTSGNSTAIVNLDNRSINGTITIEEIGDPINKTEDIGNRIGLGTNPGPIKGAKVTVNGSTEAALTAMGGYVHIRIEYNESQIGNIDENTLYIYRFVNGTGWVRLVAGNPSLCIADGRDTTANYVWVNVTNCSIFMLAGTPIEVSIPPSDSSNSGSSNGGSINGSISNSPENVEETVILRKYLGAGGSSTYNFNNIVTSVEVTPDRTYGLVAARIEVLAGQPGSITSDLPAGVLYKYVNIFVGATGWAEGKLSDSMINFQVRTSWCEKNNIDPASVVMYRHHDGEWDILETTTKEQAGGFYQYSSPTPGLSTFLILGQVLDSSAGETVTTADSGTVADSTPIPEATSTKSTPGFGILLGIMGILIAVYTKRK